MTREKSICRETLANPHDGFHWIGPDTGVPYIAMRDMIGRGILLLRSLSLFHSFGRRRWGAMDGAGGSQWGDLIRRCQGTCVVLGGIATLGGSAERCAYQDIG